MSDDAEIRALLGPAGQDGFDALLRHAADAPPGGPRACLWIDQTHHTGNGWRPNLVVENEPGYTPCPYFLGDTFAEARAAVAAINARLGYGPDDCRQIVSSSMFTHLDPDSRPAPDLGEDPTAVPPQPLESLATILGFVNRLRRIPDGVLDAYAADLADIANDLADLADLAATGHDDVLVDQP